MNQVILILFYIAINVYSSISLTSFTAILDFTNASNVTNETISNEVDTNVSLTLPPGLFSTVLQNIDANNEVGIFFNYYRTAVLFPLLPPSDDENYTMSHEIDSSVLAASITVADIDLDVNLTDPSEQVIVSLIVNRIQNQQV